MLDNRAFLGKLECSDLTDFERLDISIPIFIGAVADGEIDWVGGAGLEHGECDLFEFAVGEHQRVAIPLHLDGVDKHVEEQIEFFVGDIGGPYKAVTC